MKKPKYYTKMFGNVLMDIIPLYYDPETVEPSVYILADIEGENVQFVRLPIRAIVLALTPKRAEKLFNEKRLSKQRLNKHFAYRANDPNDSFSIAPPMEKVAELPTIDDIERIINKPDLKVTKQDMKKVIENEKVD